MSEADGLKTLGTGNTEYKTQYCPEVLETFPNKFKANENFKVELECPEFTSLCPKTAQPDFAQIQIMYSPDTCLVESKSLKLYLFGFRNHGSFHETCIQTIARDLYILMKSLWIRVRGDFFPRGGISINPEIMIKKGDEI